MANSRTTVTLSTSFGDVMISHETFDTAGVCHRGDAKLIAGQMESDIWRLAYGLDVEELRAECCEGTEPGSAEETAWSDWVDAAEAMANA